MKGWIIVALGLVLSGCGQSSDDSANAPKGAFETYTESQAQALEKAKNLEDELQNAEQARRQRLEQMQ